MIGLMAGLAILAACGGGGGGTPQATEQPATTDTAGTSVTPAADETIAVPEPRSGANLFDFAVDASLSSVAELERVGGGNLLAEWNPRNPATALAPGMKVSFFGSASACAADASNGPTVAGSDDAFAGAQALTGVAMPTGRSALRWTPGGAHAACDAAAQSDSGPSWVYVNPRAGTAGGVGMFTRSGPLASGGRPFFAAYGAGGVDGHGLNAHGLSSFVAFRRPWYAEDAVRPFAASTDGQATSARVLSRQSVGAAQLGTPPSGQTVQVKQQVVVEFINTACQKSGSGATGPCQIQYLFNTAVYRAGVTDWDRFAPPREGWLWFDADQGSVPIVEGQVPSPGQTVLDKTSGLALFASAGHPTQHQPFSDRPFDLRISFDQLGNAMRLVAASKARVAPGQVGEQALRETFGARWNDPTAWTLVHAAVGQEVYNDGAAVRAAWLGGSFRRLHVGSVN
ncbi:MAG: hypothetical protein IV094_09490 [Vitreoscilla sp.]|nr:hypothetical protein [Vitreoscilla sp.]